MVISAAGVLVTTKVEVIVVIDECIQPNHPQERHDVMVTVVGMLLATKLEVALVVISLLLANYS